MLENVWIEILNMSLTASVVIVVICLIRLFLKRTPKIFSYVLWAVVLFRLLCPVSLESAVSFFNVMDSGAASEQGRMEYISSDIGYQAQPQVQLPAGTVSGSLSAGTSGGTVNEIVSDALPAANVGDSVNPMQIVIFVTAWVWIAGVLAMAVYQLVSLLRFQKCLKGAELEEDNIYCLKGGGTPFVYGVIRPRIYLPAGLSAGERRYMLLHEQIHIRRGDQIFRFLGCAALCLHWFNPLVWLAFYLSGKDMELSCDEAVLKQLGNEVKKEYSGSLLSLAAGSGGRMIRHIPIAFGEDNVKSRIQNVLRYRKTRPVVALLAAVVCVAVAAALALNPSSEEAESESEIDQSVVEEETCVVIMADESAAGAQTPDVVLEAAQGWIASDMERWEEIQKVGELTGWYGDYSDLGQYHYLDYRISSLDLICTYENLDGADYEVWLMNYEYLVDNPDAVVLAGAMEIDSEGWLRAGYPNSQYLIFEKTEASLVYAVSFMSNDSTPEMAGFIDDVRTALANAAAQQTEFFAETSDIAESTEDTYTIVMADDSVAEEAPEVVLWAAQETVLNEMEIWRTSQEDAAFREMYGAYDYVDYRINSLELICTYENLDGADYEVWLMNYEFLVDDPEAVLILPGAMEIDSEGWLTTHPDTCYLILEKVEDTLVFVTAAGINDSSPVWNPDGFADDMRTALANAAARQTGASTETESETAVNRILGYILYLADNTAAVNTVEWLTLDDTERMEELGITGDDMPGGFLIYNADSDAESLTLAENLTALLLDWENSYNLMEGEISREEFFTILQQRAQMMGSTVDDSGYADYSQCGLFWFEVTDGVVTDIVEQYVP
ncbi:MAG: M56 family metallopeptidase [Lachnospiraceae bacterium]|nr:M56 family metallopeptidase [Lachnospiraceae bacterium]